ncbi:hypothetical protein I315_05787 [Cryptococcus gattii Ru294]|nr:hypothetical protein I315_05787 [Cryptococcus gattii Ru294]
MGHYYRSGTSSRHSFMQSLGSDRSRNNVAISEGSILFSSCLIHPNNVITPPFGLSANGKLSPYAKPSAYIDVVLSLIAALTRRNTGRNKQ